MRSARTVIAALAFALPCHAEPGLTDAQWQPSGIAPAAESAPSAPPRTTARRALDVAVAVGPGAVVHGAGHWSAGRPETARRLALTQAAGLGTMVVGLGGLAITGASRYLVAPLALATIAGAGMFFLPWLADIYGAAAHPGASGSPPRFAPAWITELGHRYVWDAQFAYRHFLVQGVDLRIGRVRLAQSGWHALDDRNVRLRVLGAYRLSGPTPARAAPDGSFLELEAAVTQHRYDSEGFRSVTGEVALAARRDLVRLDPGLRGSFVEGGFGVALQRFEYRVPGMRVEPDVNDLLLARFGFGFYFAEAGEAQVHYDHRHDDYAAGLELTGLGSGVAGHLGAEVRHFWGPWGLCAEGQVGSAFVAGVSLMFRQGAD